VLLTTHYLEEAQQLADRVLVLANGRLVADAGPDELRTRGTLTKSATRWRRVLRRPTCAPSWPPM